MEVTTWLAEISGRLEQSGIGEAVRMTPALYPILESLHILGIALLVGPALAVDLRLLGIGRDVVPMTIVARYLLPMSHAGFTVVAVTGAAMFIGIALAVTSSPAAPWKFGLIALAGVNIVIFHTGVYRTVKSWDFHAQPPLRAKVAALVSASSWMGVVAAGRFLAY
ncbi:DUF6644 family protein [Azospirillum himalayense]|uniref:DUF6644 family protein n=1 Tax=Azospirillum himalayense TaxID=654847 RepID=A0ABW0GCQ0_9PROT